MNDQDSSSSLSLHRRSFTDGDISKVLQQFRDQVGDRVMQAPKIVIFDASSNHLRLEHREMHRLLWKACVECIAIVLSNNQIIHLSTPSQSLGKLTLLDLSFNQMTTLDDDIFVSMPNLQSVRLCSNRLLRLPSSITALGNLESLNIKCNQISTFPPGMLALQNVKVIDAHQNLISEFPTWIASLNRLEHIDLSNNELSVISGIDMATAYNLTSINLRNNRIQGFGDLSIVWPSSLRVLDLWDNAIRLIPRSILTTLPSDCVVLLAGNPCTQTSRPPCMASSPMRDTGCRLLEVAARRRILTMDPGPRSLTPPICQYLETVPRPCANCPMRYLQPCAKVCFQSQVRGHPDVPVEDFVCSLACRSQIIPRVGDPVHLATEELCELEFGHDNTPCTVKNKNN